MAEAQRKFVAVANGRYAALPALTRAVADANHLAEVLATRHQFTAVVLADRPRGELQDALDQHLGEGTLPGGSLIVSWTGHGQIGPDGTLRLMGSSGNADVQVATAGQLGEWATRTGARQVLVLIDTCYSGAGLVDAVRVAAAVTGGRSAPGTAWFGVLSASLADEPARSGALSRELLRLLSEGPHHPGFRWDRTRPFIRGDDLAQAVVEDWSELRQTPHPMSFGRAWDLVRNPLHIAGVADQPVEHLLQAARGSSGEGSFFTGRSGPLREIVAWLGRRAPGLFVVTGPPGSGKSAVAGRIVSLSSAAERTRLLQADAVPGELDPGAGSVDAQLHARGATVDTAAEELARQLDLGTDAGAFAVLVEARRRRKDGDPLVIVVDGLDEAREFCRALAVELLGPLAREALVLVATRDVPIGEATLLSLLGPTAQVVDLGQDLEATRDVRDYVVRRLLGVAPAMDPARVAEEVVAQRPGADAASFLFARLVTSQLRDHPVDTSGTGWRLELAATVESALERDLQSVVLTIAGQPHRTAARELLSALALAHGGGLPADDVWPAVATALSSSGTGYCRDDAYGVLAALGRHLVAGSEGQQPVYRIAHQRLVDYLAARALGDAGQAAERRQAVARAVFRVYDELLEDGLAPREHAYLWRHAWRHLAEAGTPGLCDLRRLVARDRKAFLPDLASGLELAGSQAWSIGDAALALARHEEAVAVRRELGDPLRLAMSLFHVAIDRSSVGDEKGAAQAASEASSIAAEVRDRPEGRAVLIATLLARAVTQLREGRCEAARLLALEARALAEAPGAGAGEDAWRQVAAACTLAGRAAAVLRQLEEAARQCRHAIELVDQHGGAETGWELLGEALGQLAVVDLLQAVAAAPAPGAGYPPVVTSAAERLLAEHERLGRAGTVLDVEVARTMLTLLRARVIDLLRGRAVPDAASLPALLDRAIALVQPFAAQFADAAVVLANGLDLRAQRLAAAEPVRSAEDLRLAESCLRRFAGQSSLAAFELGRILDARNSRALADVLVGTASDLPALIGRQEEAVGLLRMSRAPDHRALLGGALDRLALLQLAAGVGTDWVARSESIAVWRSLLDVLPEARMRLVGLLADQSGRFIDGRNAEAEDLAREALAVGRTLPQQAPEVAPVLAAAELNLAAAQLLLGRPADSRALLELVIQRLEPHRANPAWCGMLATACSNLAQVEIDAGRHAQALPLARRALELLATPGIPVTSVINRPLAQLALAQAQRGDGQAELAAATLQQVIDEFCARPAIDDIAAARLATALNLAGAEAWQAALARLGERPELVRKLRVLQRRPAHEIHSTVRTLVDALATATPGELRGIREAVRQQRACDPERFDAAWREVGGPPADWLLLDPALQNTVIAWWNAPDWTCSRDYLGAHPELLDRRTDLALEELRLDGRHEQLVCRHLDLLAGARARGVDAAYAPLLAAVEMEAWTRSEDPKDHLAQHGELLRPELASVLREQAATGDASADVWVAMLQLAQRGEDALAFQAMAQPATVLDHLRAASRSRDVDRLAALATIVVRSPQADDRVTRTAMVGRALAFVLDKRPEEADSLMAVLPARLPTEERDALCSAVGDAIACHPEAAAELARWIPRLQAIGDATSE